MSIIQQIKHTNLHHIHGEIVTSKGKGYRQHNVSFVVKGKRQVRLVRRLEWIKALSKLQDGYPIHLVDQAEHLSFKEVLLPTYEDYTVQAPYVTGLIEWEGLELYILPGFLGNAVSREGDVYELYIDPKAKEWYWAEIYPNQNDCYDLINSIDGDMLEVSVDDILYLLKSDIVSADDLGNYIAKRVVSKRAEVAINEGWVTTTEEDYDSMYEQVNKLPMGERPAMSVTKVPKTVGEAFLLAYRECGNVKFKFDSKLIG